MKLQNITVKEISLVDRPANKRKFLLYKREQGEVSKVELKDLKKLFEDKNDTELQKIVDVVNQTAELKKGEDALKVATEALEKKVIEVEAAKKEALDLIEKAKTQPASADVEKTVKDAVEKATADLEKKHNDASAAIKKEYDDVIDELVKAVDLLKKNLMTKADVEGFIKAAIENFKKNIK